MSATVADVLRAVEDRFPSAWAEDWDVVGLLAGDPDAPVTGVLVTLDPTLDAVERARELGCSVLFSHHPVTLQPLRKLLPGGNAEGIVYEAVRSGVALAAAHTNLDRGILAADALVAALGLPPGPPLETGMEPVSLVTVFVPAGDCETVAAAMQTAGAGRVGEYDGCSFAAAGRGTYLPRAGTEPHIGKPGRRETAEEERLEMVCPPARIAGVVEAAAAAHPYEEPLILVTEGAMRRGAARLGRLSMPGRPLSLGDLAAQVGERLGVKPRVWGEPETRVERIAVATGSAGSVVEDAIRQGASALVCGELRYHGAMDASARGLAVVEAGHDATEWPLVPVLADAVASAAGLDPERVIRDVPTIRWWTP